MKRLLLLIAASVAVFATGCVNYGSPETASNGVIHIGQAVRSGDYANVYQQLCATPRAAVTEAEFIDSSGEALSELFTTRSWNVQDSYEDPPDLETLGPEVLEASRVIRLQRPNGDGATDYEFEFWQLTLEREDGNWRLCEFDRLAVVPPERDQDVCDRDQRAVGCASYEYEGTTIPAG